MAKFDVNDLSTLDKCFYGAQMSFVAPGRKLYCHGNLTKKCKFKDEVYTFFLFSDMLAYAAWSLEKKWILHNMLPLDKHFFAEDVADSLDLHRIKITNKKKSFIVFAGSGDEKANWLKMFKKAKEIALKPKKAPVRSAEGKQANSGNTTTGYFRARGNNLPKMPDYVAVRRLGGPAWVDTKARPQCAMCDNSFGLLQKRNNCRYCGDVFCSKCAAHKMPLPQYNYNQPEVICNDCFAGLGGKLGKDENTYAKFEGIKQAARARGMSRTPPPLQTNSVQYQARNRAASPQPRSPRQGFVPPPRAPRPANAKREFVPQLNRSAPTMGVPQPRPQPFMQKPMPQRPVNNQFIPRPQAQRLYDPRQQVQHVPQYAPQQSPPQQQYYQQQQYVQQEAAPQHQEQPQSLEQMLPPPADEPPPEPEGAPQIKSKFCTNCGEPVSLRFCMSCGEPTQ